MNQIQADLAAEVDPAINKELSESGLVGVFTSEFGRLKRIVAGMGLNASDGEDVLQEVFIRTMKQQGNVSRANVSRASRPRTRAGCPRHEEGVRWLIKVTINQCLMEHRSRKRFRRQAREILRRRGEMKGAATTAVEKAIVAEELEIVRETMKDLDDSLLAPMVLQYFCDLNSTEVGRILGLNPSTVRSRLREGRMILAKRLLERGVGT